MLGYALTCSGQVFRWPARYAIPVPRPVYLQLKHQVQVVEHWGEAPDRFTYLPVYNVLHPTQRTFTEGIYYNVGSVHDTGRLFIYHQGKVTFLRSSPPATMLHDYQAFLTKHALSQRTQAEYYNAIAAFQPFLLNP